MPESSTSSGSIRPELDMGMGRVWTWAGYGHGPGMGMGRVWALAAKGRIQLVTGLLDLQVSFIKQVHAVTHV